MRCVLSGTGIKDYSIKGRESTRLWKQVNVLFMKAGIRLSMKIGKLVLHDLMQASQGLIWFILLILLMQETGIQTKLLNKKQTTLLVYYDSKSRMNNEYRSILERDYKPNQPLWFEH